MQKYSRVTRDAQEDLRANSLLVCSLSRTDDSVHTMPSNKHIVFFDCSRLSPAKVEKILAGDILVAAALLTADRIVLLKSDTPLGRVADPEGLTVVFATGGTAGVGAACGRRIRKAMAVRPMEARLAQRANVWRAGWRVATGGRRHG